MPSLAKRGMAKQARSGARLYLDVLRLVRRGVGTDRDISALLDVKNDQTVPVITNGLWALGVIRPVEWVRPACSHYWVAVWRVGDGVAAVPPEGAEITPQRRPLIGLVKFAHWWQELESPVSRAELCDAAGYVRTTCAMLLSHARARKMVYVTAWRPSGTNGDFVPLYRGGTGPDAVKPEGMPVNERNRIQGKRRRMRDKSAALHFAMTGAAAQAVRFDNSGKPRDLRRESNGPQSVSSVG